MYQCVTYHTISSIYLYDRQYKMICPVSLNMACTIWHKKMEWVAKHVQARECYTLQDRNGPSGCMPKGQDNSSTVQHLPLESRLSSQDKQYRWLFTDLPQLYKTDVGSMPSNNRHTLKTNVRSLWSAELHPEKNSVKTLAISFQYLSCWWWGICGDLLSVRPSLIIEHYIDVIGGQTCSYMLNFKKKYAFL